MVMKPVDLSVDHQDPVEGSLHNQVDAMSQLVDVCQLLPLVTIVLT